MSEPEFDIDEAEAAYNAERAGEGEEIEEDEIPKGEDEDTPPGYKSYEDYVADGGDPDLFVGKKAFEDRYANIQENKRLRGDVKTLQGTVQQTMDAVNDWQAQQREQVREEVEAELAEAKANEDVTAALAAQGKLDAIATATAKPNAPQAENPTITDFREANPLIDGTSDQFNEEFNADVEAVFNTFFRQGLTKTDAQIKRALKASVAQAKTLHPELFESQRNKRAGQKRETKRAAKQQPSGKRAEDYKIDNPRNPRQVDAAPEVRDMIRKTAEKNATKAGKSPEDVKKAGDIAADNFEKSLHE